MYILFPRELINICIDHLENDVSGRLARLVSKSTESWRRNMEASKVTTAACVRPCWGKAMHAAKLADEVCPLICSVSSCSTRAHVTLACR